MLSAANPLALSTLNGANGFRIEGIAANDMSGFPLSNAGDVNGDGYDDILIGAWLADPGGKADAGESYVVFGKSGGFTAAFDLSTLDGTNGFRIAGITANDGSGRSVSSAGDVNGDGFADLLVGANFAAPGGNALSGQSYLLFGKSSGFAATLDLTTLNGTNGFRIDGLDARDASDLSVSWVSGAGDVNGDGFDDVIVGASGGDGTNNLKLGVGETYVIFGKSSGFAAAFDLRTLNGTNGFRIDGVDPFDGSGFSVSSAGDINGDGCDDVILANDSTFSSGAGKSYVVFGKPSGFAAALDLSTLNGTNGFRLDGLNAYDFLGFSVSGAGDVNGDGFDDLILGAPWADPGENDVAGQTYLVFGKSSGFASAFDLSTLNGTNGFRVDGLNANDASGLSVSGAGDVNGDGFDDFLIGAGGSDPSGNTDAGESYLVFGKASGFPAALDLSTLNGTNGFRLDGIAPADAAGLSVSKAGDVNGDGFGDLLIGANHANPNENADAGESYIVFGGNFTGGVETQVGTSSANSLAATHGAAIDVLIGAQGNDTLTGDGGSDVLLGGQGNDTLTIVSTEFRRVVGGLGTDTLNLSGSGLTLNLTTLSDNRLQGIEQIDITGSGNNTLTLNLAEVLNLSHETNTLLVRRNTGDAMNLGTGWTQGANETIDGSTFEVFRQGAATLKVQAPLSTEVSVSVSPASVAEDGTPNLVYTFTRVGITSGALTVQFTVGGTATFATDYTQTGAATFTAASGTLTFASGQTTKSITINPKADTTIEADESVILTLAPAPAYTLGLATSATGTITNDDFPKVTVTVTPASVLENGTANATYTFTRTGLTTNPLTVNFSVGGTATLNTDYTTSGADSFSETTGSVTFASGQATKTVTIDPTGDTMVEANETVVLSLAADNRYLVGTAKTATATITNDDTEISVSVSPAAVSEDGTPNLIYTFTRAGSTSGGLTVGFTVSGTATLSSDYVQSGAATFSATAGTLSFSSGQTKKTITINPTADAVVEPDETVLLTLTPAATYTVGTANAATGTITNDDPRVTVAVSPVSIAENGTTNATYTFKRTGPTTNPLTVSFDVGGTATFETDYSVTGASSFTEMTGSVTFLAGQASKTIVIDPTGDTVVEANETVVLTLTAGVDYVVGLPLAATATITNDDTEISVTVSPSSVVENGAPNLIYTFTRIGVTTNLLSVNFTVGGTATFSNDYSQTGAASFNAALGRITFSADQTTKTITINPTGDTTEEPDETLILAVTPGATYSAGAANTALGTITNDDGLPLLSLMAELP